MINRTLKTTFFCFLTFFINGYCIAQYEPFILNEDIHYQDESCNVISGLRFDSIVAQSDTITYKPKAEMTLFWDAHRWINNEVMLLPNGDHLFRLESINWLMKGRAQVGESWVAYENDTMRVELTCVGIDYDSVLGEWDEVKSFTMKFLTPSAVALPNEFADYEIRLSKSNGYISFFHPHFLTRRGRYAAIYNLIGSTKNAFGYQNVTWRSVFDFQVNDVFHTYLYDSIYTYGQMGWFKYRELYLSQEILEKAETDSAISYKVLQRSNERHVSFYQQHFDSVSIDSLTITYKKINSNFDLIVQSEYIDKEDGFHRRTLGGIGKFGFSKLIQDSYHHYGNTRGTCDSLWLKWYSDQFICHAGGPYYDFLEVGFYGHIDVRKRQLVYKKSGNTEIGKPLDWRIFIKEGMSNVNDQHANANDLNYLKIQPNPVTADLQIHLKRNEQVASVYILDQLGIEQQRFQQQFTSDISIPFHAAPGIYFCVLELRDGRKKVMRFVNI